MATHTSVTSPSGKRRREVSRGYACDISDLLRESPGLTLRDVTRRFGWRSNRVRAALDAALQLGIIRAQEPGRMERWHRYFYAELPDPTPLPTAPAEAPPVVPVRPTRNRKPAPLRLEHMLRLMRRKGKPVTISWLCRALRWGAPRVHMALDAAMAAGKVTETPRQFGILFAQYTATPSKTRKAPTP